MSKKFPVAALLPLILLAALPYVGVADYYLSYLYIVFFWIVLATSWGILSGYSGYWSFGHAGFFGAGVYTTATLAGKLGVPFLRPFRQRLLSRQGWRCSSGWSCSGRSRCAASSSRS